MLIHLEYSELEAFKYYCKNNHILITHVEYGQDIVCKIELEAVAKDKLLQDFETKKVIFKNEKELTKKYITKSIEKK